MQTRFIQLVLALLGGMAIFLVLCTSAWYNLRGEPNVCFRQSSTRRLERFIVTAIEEYKKEHNNIPKSLADVSNLPKTKGSHGGIPADAWGRLFHYKSFPDGTYELYSFGRDGKSGGVGLDADLYHDGRNRDVSLATFRQFFTVNDAGEVDKGQFLVAAFVMGACVGYTIFGASRKQSWSKDSPNRLGNGLAIFATVVLACVIGVLLMPFHIPSGH